MRCGSGALCLLALLHSGAALQASVGEGRAGQGPGPGDAGAPEAPEADPEPGAKFSVLSGQVLKMVMTLHTSKNDAELQSTCEQTGRMAAQEEGTEFRMEVRRRHLLETVADVIESRMDNTNLIVECIVAVDKVVRGDRETTSFMWDKTRLVSMFSAAVQRYSADADMTAKLSRHWGAFAPACCPEQAIKVKEMGGLDSLFGAIDRFPANPGVQLSAWSGLASLAQSPEGASTVSNHGGPSAGIQRIVATLRDSIPNLPRVPAPVTVGTKVLQTMYGILNNDATGVFHKAWKTEEMPREFVNTMVLEHDVRATQDVSCNTINQVTHNQDPEWQNLLGQQGALETIASAVKNFQDADPTPYESGTVTEKFPVLPSCMWALVNLVDRNSRNQQLARRLAILTYLEPVMSKGFSDAELQGQMAAAMRRLKDLIAPNGGGPAAEPKA